MALGMAQRQVSDHAGPILARRNEFSIVQCQSCGYAHAMPLPDVESLIETYRHDYYVTDKPFYLERYEQDRDWWLDVYSDRLAVAEDEMDLNPGTALDIGCGPGLFLDAAIARGWQASGVEPSRQAAAHACKSGHSVHDGFFGADLAATLEPVDFVHLALVLEHVPDPAEMLAAAKLALKPEGVICVVVPNDFNPLQQVAADRDGDAFWVAPPHHLNYFTFASLDRLLATCGLVVRHQTTTFPMELFLADGRPLSGRRRLGACLSRPA